MSPSNGKREIDEKVKAFLAAGAKEVWIVSEKGEIRIFDENGAIGESPFGIRIELPPPVSE